ncbi:MAG: alpha-L-fucosidase [bacterium]
MTDTYLPADVMSRADWYVNDRFGMFIHWGLYAIQASGEWCLTRDAIPYDEYRAFQQRFNPTEFDAEQWAGIAKDAGMKYMVFTTKHHDGFCMFDSPYTDWKITNTPFKRDVTRELVTACNKNDLRVGLYHSLIDWMHPDYTLDEIHPLRNDEKVKAEPRDQQRYATYLQQSLRYLFTRYGQIDILWLDFTPQGKGPDDWRAGELDAMIRELQPNVLYDDRLGDKEKFPGDFTTPEQVLPATPVYVDGKRRVWEACVTMNSAWGYRADDANFKPTRTLIHMLARCVSNDGNLLLNVGPDAHGRIPAESVKRLAEIGEWMRQNGESIYGAGMAPGLVPPPGCVYTQKGNRLFLHVLDWPYLNLRLPGLRKSFRFASFLRDGARLKVSGWQNTDEDIAISLPYHEPDPLDTVIEIELG